MYNYNYSFLVTTSSLLKMKVVAKPNAKWCT